MYLMGQQRSPINCSSSETIISKWYYARGGKKRVLQSLTLAIKCSGLEVTNTTATRNSLARNNPLGLSTKEEPDVQSYCVLGKEGRWEWSYAENSTHDVIPRYHNRCNLPFLEPDGNLFIIL